MRNNILDRMRRCAVGIFVIFPIAGGAILFSGSAARSAVNVLQVEVDYSSATGYQYAPVDFNGSTTQTFGSVTCHALSTTTSSTYSAHAAVVSSDLLSAAGSGTVTDIYCLNAARASGDSTSTSFLETYVWDVQTDGSTGPAPIAVGNNIKVVNNSWIGDYGNTTNGIATDTAAIQRIDYMVDHNDLVMVNGAVTGAYSSSPASLVWSSRNGIAVRGATFSTANYNSYAFHPSDVAAGIGKTHADLWGPVTSSGGDTDPSYETASVSGYAAALVAAAGTHSDWSSANSSNGLHHEVVKSILMTGASTTAFDTTVGGFSSWTNDTANNLDALNGAGRVDYATSLEVLNGGPKKMASVSGSTVNSPTVATTTAGWVYNSSSLSSPFRAGSSEALIVNLAGKTLTGLTATLAWDAPNLSSSTFTNLDLELVHVIKTGSTYTLGSAVSIKGAVSDTGSASGTVSDNLEHLYFTGATLTDGLYAFVISNVDTTSFSSEGYGFSYIMTTAATPIPEPGALVLLLTGSFTAWLFWRRRKTQ